MITVTKENNMNYVTIDTLRTPLIYLDQCALVYLSSNESVGCNFLSTFRNKGTLLFSWINVYDIAGVKGQAVAKIRNFLDEIGDHWFPIKFNFISVIQNEERVARGEVLNSVFFDESFLRVYYPQIHGREKTLSSILDLSALSEEFQYVHRKQSQGIVEMRDWINSQFSSQETRSRLGAKVFKKDTGFDMQFRCRSIYRNLFNLVYREKILLNTNDLIDFWHAVVPLAYADRVVLDKKWEDYIRKISLPTSWAKCYSAKPSSVEKFLEDFENSPSA